MLDIRKIISILIYNLKLATISYFYYLEVIEDLEETLGGVQVRVSFSSRG